MATTMMAQPEAPQSAPVPPRRKLWEITHDVVGLETMLEGVLDLEFRAAAEKDPALKAQLLQEVEDLRNAADASFLALLPELQQKAGGIVALIRQAEGMAALAKAEAQRIQKLQKQREGMALRLRVMLKRGMDAMGFADLDGATFKVSITKAGGNPKVVRISTDPVPVALAGKCEVDPAALCEAVQAMVNPYAPHACTIDEIYACLHAEGALPELDYSATKVLEAVKQGGGAVPDGFKLERGENLVIK